MTNRTAAARYARALFDVDVKDHDLQEVEASLAQFQGLVTGHNTLTQVFHNPAIPAQRKRAIVVELLGQLPLVAIPVSRLLTLLAERDRLVLLADVVQAFRVRLLKHQGIVEAEVVTAAPLSPEQTAQVERTLADASGCQIRLKPSVDPEILGGIVARFGGTVYDGSVANHFQRLRTSLLG